MNDQRPVSGKLDTSRYARPNKNWLCGHACDGCPCRIGPSPSGECRATNECQPVLELREGETKGMWKCTRTNEWGGPCQDGPRPDGTCCRPIPKCRPVRSLRNRRGLVTRAVATATIAAVLIGFSASRHEQFIDPGRLSVQHSGPEFARRAAARGGGEGCVSCHAEAQAGLGEQAGSALHAAKTSLTLAHLLSPEPRDTSRIDRSCVECHRTHSFHHANVVHENACSTCHQEHQGPAGLMAAAGAHCTKCHGAHEEMAASAAKGRTLAADSSPHHPAAGVGVHPVARPAAGSPQVIHGFHLDHPEFRVNRPPATDPNPIKFNHQIHLSGDIPPVNGRRLECASCHQPDTSGASMRRVSFEQNCRACHSLRVDEANPSLVLPHGDAAAARSVLRSLPMHYADLARRERGLVRESEVTAFVDQQMRALRARAIGGENLERAVFFGGGSGEELTTIGGVQGTARLRLGSCATCHEVTARGEMTPEIAPPRTPDRWMAHARFNHRSHDHMQCTQCHAAGASSRTSDVLMPSIKSCVSCHSPKGGVQHDCSTCHVYHNQPVHSLLHYMPAQGAP